MEFLEQLKRLFATFADDWEKIETFARLRRAAVCGAGVPSHDMIQILVFGCHILILTFAKNDRRWKVFEEKKK